MLFALLFLSACIGHAAIWVVAVNWLYGSRFRGWAVDGLRHLLQLFIVAGPLLFLYLSFSHESGEPARRAPFDEGVAFWIHLPPWVLGYVAACWLMGCVVFPLQTVGRWRRRRPAPLLSNHTHTIDVAKELGTKPYGHGFRVWKAYLPYNEIFQVDFTELTLRLPGLPTRWDGLTIMHLSDLHLCGVPDRNFFEWVMDRCAQEPCDILALTGDVLDRDHHYEWIAPVLSRLRWQEAAFAILGNHDSWGDVPRIRRQLEDLGITQIGSSWRQMAIRGHRLIVIGNEMPWLPPLPDLRDCPPDGFRLCLSHSPDQLPWAKRHGIHLMLAGHNHGGQIRFPLIGPVFVPSVYSRRYDGGLYYEPPTLLHVSRGLGGTHPLRWNCRPEVTRIVLRAGARL